MNDTNFPGRPVENLYYSEQPTQQPATINHYYRLIITHIICLAVVCILTMVNIMQTHQVAELVRAEKNDTIRYLQDAERALDQKMELHLTLTKLELAEEIKKTLEKFGQQGGQNRAQQSPTPQN